MGIKLILPVILILVSLTVLGGERAAPSTITDETAERKRAVAQCKLAAARFKRDQDKTAAREAFSAVAQIDPTYPMPLFYLGALADADGRKDEAIQYYEKFVKLDDQSDSFVTAQLRLDELRKPAGVQSPKAAEAGVNTQYDVDVARAQRLNSEGKWTEAAGLAAGAIKMSPKRWEAYLVAGASNAKQKQFDLAGAQFKAAFDLETLPVSKKAGVASAIERCGKESEAQALVNQATDALNANNYNVAGEKFSQAFAKLPEMEEWGWSAALAFAVAQKYDLSIKLLTTLAASKNAAMAQQAAEKLTKVKSLIAAKATNDNTTSVNEAENASSPASKFITPKSPSIDKDVEYATGMQFFNGSAVAKDYAKAMVHLRRAAELGHGEATQQIAEIYCHGYGVDKNQAIGAEWHKKAVTMGSVAAEVSLGGHYLNGEGVQEDVNAGVSWYKSAANKNNDEAWHQLGHLYEKGLGVPKNANEAVRLFRLAAEKGNNCAQNSLGAKYELGIRGLKKNVDEAFTWYEKAAAGGHIEAQYNLGMLYMRGRGVEKDSDKAIEWFSKAAASGHESAKKELNRLQK